MPGRDACGRLSRFAPCPAWQHCVPAWWLWPALLWIRLAAAAAFGLADRSNQLILGLCLCRHVLITSSISSPDFVIRRRDRFRSITVRPPGHCYDRQPGVVWAVRARQIKFGSAWRISCDKAGSRFQLVDPQKYCAKSRTPVSRPPPCLQYAPWPRGPAATVAPGSTPGRTDPAPEPSGMAFTRVDNREQDSRSFSRLCRPWRPVRPRRR